MLFVKLLFFITIVFAQDIVVKLPDGFVRGLRLSTFSNFSYFAFRQVPYAKPPIGSLRFQPPVAVESWEGVLNATENTKICYQIGVPDAKENEDCLYLNIYTPLEPVAEGILPVIVYIHGGAFILGNSIFESTGPEFFMDYDVVIVTLQYRLGAFGFLSTQDAVIPGNNGLKDILFALKWVKNHISIFGGNPNKVTLAGQSAGAALVGYHVISEKSEGLFRAAIMESGSALCSWAYQRDAKKYAHQLATAIDSSFSETNSSEELLTLLLDAPAKNINNAKMEGVTGLQLGQGDVFAPVIEVKHEDAFISDFMHTRLIEGRFNQVPVIMGVNSEEMIYLAGDLNHFKEEMGLYDQNVSLLVNEDYRVRQENLEPVGNLIRSIYTNGSFADNLGAALKFRSDVRYTTAVARQAALQSRFSEVYFYVFSFHGFLGNQIVVDGADRVGHSEELTFMWRQYEYNSDLSKYPVNDLLTHYRMLKLWIDFALYMNPTREPTAILENIVWPEVTPNNFSYLNIDENLSIETDPKEYQEWKKIIDVYGNQPFDTY